MTCRFDSEWPGFYIDLYRHLAARDAEQAAIADKEGRYYPEPRWDAYLDAVMAELIEGERWSGE